MPNSSLKRAAANRHHDAQVIRGSGRLAEAFGIGKIYAMWLEESVVEFPLNSLGAFAVGFGITSLLCGWLRTYVFGWYETKWSADFNFAIDIVAASVVFVPIAMLGFAFGAYLVNTECDPWRHSLIGGMLLAVAFFAVTRLALWMDSAILLNMLVWSTLLLGSGGVGVWARHSARQAET